MRGKGNLTLAEGIDFKAGHFLGQDGFWKVEEGGVVDREVVVVILQDPHGRPLDAEGGKTGMWEKMGMWGGSGMCERDTQGWNSQEKLVGSVQGQTGVVGGVPARGSLRSFQLKEFQDFINFQDYPGWERAPGSPSPSLDIQRDLQNSSDTSRDGDPNPTLPEPLPRPGRLFQEGFSKFPNLAQLEAVPS